MSATLVKIDYAACLLKKTPQQVFHLVDGGNASEVGLLWIWNVARNLNGCRRELRFWQPELEARAQGQPSKYHKHNLAAILAQMLPGTRQRFNAGDVDRLFQIRPRTRLDYLKELPGQLAAGRNVYTRQTLESFLTRRWLGSASSSTPTIRSSSTLKTSPKPLAPDAPGHASAHFVRSCAENAANPAFKVIKGNVNPVVTNAKNTPEANPAT